MQTEISVVIPNWNGDKTLEAVIRSCLNQTLPPIEVLVCDDGSTDDSKKVIEQINDKRIIWVPSQHSGTPAVPRNNGIKVSKGEWIAFCDNDDNWLPTKLEKQISLAKKLNCRATCSNALIKMNGKITNKKTSNLMKNTITFSDILKSNDIVCSSAMIHSSILKVTGEFSPVVEHGSFADYIYWLRILTQTKFAFVNEPLVIYDDHPETSIRSLFLDDKILKKQSFKNFASWVKKEKDIRLYFFILQLEKYNLIIWLKKLLNKIIL